MIAILWIVAYAAVAVFIGRSIYNTTLLEEYNKRLNNLQSQLDHMKKWHLEYHKKETLEEVALDEVYKFTMTREAAVFTGIFWPLTGLWYLLYLKSKNCNVRIMPKNVVEKQIALQKDKEASDKKYEEALKILKDAGIEDVQHAKELQEQNKIFKKSLEDKGFNTSGIDFSVGLDQLKKRN